MRETLVPNLPAGFGGLYSYLLARDIGAPSDGMVAQPLTQSGDGAAVVDRISWAYAARPALDFRAPDGFLVWWQQGETDDPLDGGVLVAGLSYSMTWPADVPRSYAVAPVRIAYQGLQAAAKQQHDSWRVTA